MTTWSTVANFLRRHTNLPFTFLHAKVTPLTVRSRPAVLHGEPAVIAGVAARAVEPENIQTSEAAVSEKNERREWWLTMRQA